jgi:N-acetylglucosamine-6-phosphate deacetylase
MSRPEVRLFGQVYSPAPRGLAVVAIEGGRITRIEPASRKPAGALGDATLRIVPGLIDIQINGAFGQDFSDPEADLALAARELPRFGVTAFLPTVISSPANRYAPCLANLRGPVDRVAAQPLGVHIEGPFLSELRRGTHDPGVLRDPSWPEAEQWLAQGNVRIVTLAPERPGAIELIDPLVRKGVVVSIGHSDATWAQAAAAVAAGASLGTHLFNAMRPFSHRDPAIAGFLLGNDVAASFIADGVHLAPETLRLICRAKRPGDLVLITDALAGLGVDDAAFELAGQDLVRDGLVARRRDGTLSGSLLPLPEAIRNVVALDVAPEVAIAAATANPARVIGDRRRGVLREGGRADVAVFDESWAVVATYVAGREAFGAARST